MLYVLFPDGRVIRTLVWTTQKTIRERQLDVQYAWYPGDQIVQSFHAPMSPQFDPKTIVTENMDGDYKRREIKVWRRTHSNLKRCVFELRRVLMDGDRAIETRVVEFLGIIL